MKRTPHAQNGLTLLELMISLALGLLVVLALITMLINVNRNQLELSGTNRVMENGRFALQFLQSEVSHAGYWGGHVPQFDDLTLSAPSAPADVPTAVPDPCLEYTPANWTAGHINNIVGIAVQGTDIPDPVPSPATTFCGGIITSPQAGTDVLVVRGVEPCLAGSSTEDCSDTRAAASPHLYFQVSSCSEDPAGYMFATSGFSLHAGDCVAGTPVTGTAGPVRRFSSSLLYVRSFATTAGDGIPTLMRARFSVPSTTTAGSAPQFTQAQALIEGIEGFRVEYAVDNLSDTGATVDAAALGAAISWQGTTVLNTPTNRGNGLPDTYVRCTQASPCTVNQLVNVVAVKVYVLARAESRSPGYVNSNQYCLRSVCSVAADYMGPFNDGYKRQLFTQTIRVVNVAGRRETP